MAVPCRLQAHSYAHKEQDASSVYPVKIPMKMDTTAMLKYPEHAYMFRTQCFASPPIFPEIVGYVTPDKYPNIGSLTVV
jgi:hypothetical protein